MTADAHVGTATEDASVGTAQGDPVVVGLVDEVDAGDRFPTIKGLLEQWEPGAHRVINSVERGAQIAWRRGLAGMAANRGAVGHDAPGERGGVALTQVAAVGGGARPAVAVDC